MKKRRTVERFPFVYAKQSALHGFLSLQSVNTDAFSTPAIARNEGEHLRRGEQVYILEKSGAVALVPRLPVRPSMGAGWCRILTVLSEVVVVVRSVGPVID